MTSQPSQSALDAETEAGIRHTVREDLNALANLGVPSFIRDHIESDLNEIGGRFENALAAAVAFIEHVGLTASRHPEWPDEAYAGFLGAADGARHVIREILGRDEYARFLALNAGASPSTAEETPE